MRTKADVRDRSEFMVHALSPRRRRSNQAFRKVTTIRPLRLCRRLLTRAHAAAQRDEPGGDLDRIARYFLAEQFEQSGHERSQRAAMLAIQIIVALRERRAAQRLQLQFGRQHRKPGIELMVEAHFSIPAMVLATSPWAWLNAASIFARSSIDAAVRAPAGSPPCPENSK